MKTLTTIAIQTVNVALFASLAGCAIPSRDISKPAGGKGFGLVVYSSGVMHKHRRFELRRWEPDEKASVIWPELTWQWIIKDDMAVFLGWLNKGSSFASSPQWLQLFVAEGAGPAVNLTDEIVLQYVKSHKPETSDSIEKYSVGPIKEQNGHFLFTVSEIGKEDGTLKLAKDQILDLVHRAKQSGALRKDPIHGTPYIE